MKKTYITPETSTFHFTPVCIIAESLGKGEGDFNPESMTFTREDRGWDIWGNDADDDFDE